MSNKQIPKPERISEWGRATEIIYSCRRCGTSFGFYRTNEKFCHNCGCENNWDKVPTNLSEECAQQYHCADFLVQQETMKQLDKLIISSV